MIHNDTWYEVKTHWGWFRLDEGAYRDYLQGKLWITWKPGRPQEQQKIDGAVELMPTNISEEAVQLRDKAGRYGVYAIAKALNYIVYKAKVVVEPSAAIGVAALISGGFKVKPGEKVCFVLTGGNIDPKKLIDLTEC